MQKIITPELFCIVCFSFYGFSKKNVTFIRAISKFLQDDRNIMQLDMKEFRSASPRAALLPDSWPFPSLPWISSFFKTCQPSYCIYGSEA